MHVFSTGPESKRGALRQRLAELGTGGKLQAGVKLLLQCAIAFCLAPTCVGSLWIPVLFGFLLSLEPELPSLLAAGAGCLGGLVFWGEEVVIQITAGAVMCLLAGGILGGTALWKTDWGQALICTAVAAAVTGTFLLTGEEFGRKELGQFLFQVCGAVLSQWIFAQAGKNPDSLCRDGAAAILVLGLCQIPLFRVVNLGLLGAALFSCGSDRFSLALLCGIGADLSGVTQVPVAAIMCVSHLLKVHGKSSLSAPLVPALGAGAAGLAAGTFDPVAMLSFFLGALPAPLLLPKKKAQPAQLHPEALLLASGAMEHMAKALNQSLPEADAAPELFDQAAREACTGCSRYQTCWNTQSQSTYTLLAGALPGLLAGQGLPQEFLHRCRKPEAFQRSIQRGLRELRLRRQYNRHLQMCRGALSRQYDCLSRYLEHLASPPAQCGEKRYEVHMGMCQSTPCGQAESGDQAIWFSGTDCRFFVLLCDGMGTGKYASEQSKSAISLIKRLLQAGMEAQEALLTLNDFYVLSDQGGFSTADLLEIHLDTGRAQLCKWGAAPSYLKHRGYVKALGTAGPPPGMGMDQVPEVIRLSLQRGQTVVLVSDGVDGEDVLQRIACGADMDPQSLAWSVTAGDHRLAEDDRTAVAVCLSPLPASTL